MKNLVSTFTLILLTFIMGSGCIDDSQDLKQELILDTWISSDKSDTLHFVDHSNFYRSSSTMHYDHYDYELFTDSIKVGYSGILYIAVEPTIHKYSINKERLIIEFDNRQCYGFDLAKKTYENLD